jgi:opacity protein-like surface antigen
LLAQTWRTRVANVDKEHQMIPMNRKPAVTAALIPVLLAVAAAASAQQTSVIAQPAPAFSRWTFDVGIGWDNSLAGHINSSGIGEIDGQAVVITSNTYEEVYGTGLNLRFGGGYVLNEATEITGMFMFQSLDADQVTAMGDIGVSNLYGRYTDYQTFSLDGGFRRYHNFTPVFRLYGEGTLGLGFVDKTDLELVAPGANLTREANDVYDQTAAWSMGANVGLLVQTGGKMGFYGQLGLRYMSGLAEIDDLVGTGLETINDKSSRWTLPFVGGIRMRF